MQAARRAPQDKRLDVFVGDWRNSGELKPGPFDPGGSITGSTSYAWKLGSTWLLYESELSLPGLGAYEVRGGLRFNSQAGKYEAYAVNSLGALLVYEGEWLDDSTLVFTSVYPLPAGRARVTYEIVRERSLRMISESLNKEGRFEAYFITDMERS